MTRHHKDKEPRRPPKAAARQPGETVRESSGHYAHRPDTYETGVSGSTFDQVGACPAVGCGGGGSDLSDLPAEILSPELESGGPGPSQV